MLDVEFRISGWNKYYSDKLSEFYRNVSADLYKVCLDIFNEAKDTTSSPHDTDVRYGNAPSVFSGGSNLDGSRRYYEKRPGKKPPDSIDTEYGYPKIDFYHEGYVDDTGKLRKSIQINDMMAGLKYNVNISVGEDYWYWVENAFGYKVISHAIFNNIHKLGMIVESHINSDIFLSIFMDIIDNSFTNNGFKVISK